MVLKMPQKSQIFFKDAIIFSRDIIEKSNINFGNILPLNCYLISRQSSLFSCHRKPMSNKLNKNVSSRENFNMQATDENVNFMERIIGLKHKHTCIALQELLTQVTV